MSPTSAVPFVDGIFSDVYGSSYPFHVEHKASVNFVRSSFQNIDVNGGVLDIGVGGIGRFVNSTFQNIHTPEDLMVTAIWDDYWEYVFADSSMMTSGPRPQQDVVRSVMRGVSGESMDNRSRCSEVYIAEDDVLYNLAYGQFDYDLSTGALSACFKWKGQGESGHTLLPAVLEA